MGNGSGIDESDDSLGGGLGHRKMYAASQVYEVTRQLRGEVEPERQVEGAKIGLTDTLGGDGGTLVNMILQRGW